MAKQTINNGTVAGDGTGEVLFNAFEKVNDNFNEVYLTNVVHINSPDDFPAAVGGVRELVPVVGDKITYIISAKIIDMGSDRFTITGGEVQIKGEHRTASAIGSTTTDALFTAVDSFLILEYFVVSCSSGKVVDFSAPALGQVSFGTTNLIVLDCDTIFDISNSFATTFRELVVFNATTNGILFTGTINSQLGISNTLGTSWGGTFIDLGTTTFDLISIGSGNRFISPAATTILSGAVSSGNLNAGGRGLVSGNIFNGAGTALSGIDVDDLQYTFKDNVFADDTTKNTQVVAGDYLSASTTTTIGAIGVYVAVGGVNWVSDDAHRFTTSTSGLLTYIGLETVDVNITATSTVEKVGGGSDVICSKIAINGIVSDKTIACTQSTAPTGIVSIGLFELATGDTVQLFVGNEGSTANIEVSTANIIVSQR